MIRDVSQAKKHFLPELSSPSELIID